MKIEQLIVQHFYNNKKVTLQGMGTFTLSPDFVLMPDNDKEVVMPDNAISFEYNIRSTEDDALIDYIVQQSRKIKPLASADLDSYLTLGKQFLNIGKPFRIEGMGVLEKNQSGQYQFTQGHAYQSKPESAAVAVKEKREDEDISFASARPASNNNKSILMIVLGVAVLGLIGAAAWYFFIRKSPAPTPVAETPVVVTDTVQTVSAKPDSIPAPAVQKIPGDSSVFKIVIKEYQTYETAQRAFDRLSGYGHKLLLYTADSVTYKIAMPFMRPLSDTAMARDSVKKKLFGGNPYIELK